VKLIILGGPGAGKGTQSELLAAHLQITKISTGDILREAIASQSFLGIKAQDFVSKGEFVPDEILIEFMRERLLKPDLSQGWILEGYPRTAFQAEELDFLLDEINQRLNWAIYLEVKESMMMRRSLERNRNDDQPEVIKRRIEMFEERTIPILEYYDRRQKLLTINGENTREKILEEIVNQLSLTMDKDN